MDLNPSRSEFKSHFVFGLTPILSSGFHARCSWYWLAGQAPTQWQTVRWPALPERLWWRDKWVRAVTPGRSLDPLSPRNHPDPIPHPSPLIQESPWAEAGDGGSIFIFIKNRLLYLMLYSAGVFFIYDQINIVKQNGKNMLSLWLEYFSVSLYHWVHFAIMLYLL